MRPPVEPKKEDCCGSGCNPCIFDVYEKQLHLYKLIIESGEHSISSVENAMSQLECKQFHVIKNIDISEQHRLILFKQNEADKCVLWSPGDHFLLKYQSEQATCSRAYTPIKLEHLIYAYDFAVIVKQYIKGPVSNYLCNLNAGETTYWRGPYGQYQLDSNRFSRLIMIAQGTGIAPFFSIIKQILNDEENMTNIILLFCCKSVNTILLRDELYLLKSYWNFKYMIYVSENYAVLKYKEPILIRRLTKNDVLNLKPFMEKDQFLLCGSEEFMMHYNKILVDECQNLNIVKF